MYVCDTHDRRSEVLLPSGASAGFELGERYALHRRGYSIKLGSETFRVCRASSLLCPALSPAIAIANAAM